MSLHRILQLCVTCLIVISCDARAFKRQAPTKVVELCSGSKTIVVDIGDKTQGIVRSANYSVSNYRNNTKCNVVFRTQGSALLVRVLFKSFDVELESRSCLYDKLCVFNVKYCGNWATGQTFEYVVPANKTFTFNFVTDLQISAAGFELYVNSTAYNGSTVMSPTSGIGSSLSKLKFSSYNASNLGSYTDKCKESVDVDLGYYQFKDPSPNMSPWINTTAAPTTRPANTTVAPSNTTTKPANTTLAPILNSTTTKPANTTLAPITNSTTTTTAKPANTTLAPITNSTTTTTAKPANTTLAPITNSTTATTAKPANTTLAPITNSTTATTAKPANTTLAPITNSTTTTTAKPANTTLAPITNSTAASNTTTIKPTNATSTNTTSGAGKRQLEALANQLSSLLKPSINFDNLLNFHHLTLPPYLAKNTWTLPPIRFTVPRLTDICKYSPLLKLCQ